MIATATLLKGGLERQTSGESSGGQLCLLRSESLCEDYSRHRLTAVRCCQSSLGGLCVSRALWVRVPLLGSAQSVDQNQWFVNSSYSQQLLLTTEGSARNPIANSHIWDTVWVKKKNKKIKTLYKQQVWRFQCSVVCEFRRASSQSQCRVEFLRRVHTRRFVFWMLKLRLPRNIYSYL